MGIIQLSLCHIDHALLLNRRYFNIYFNETTQTQSPTKKSAKISRKILKKNNTEALNYYVLRYYKSREFYEKLELIQVNNKINVTE